MRPRIAITGPVRGGAVAWWFTALAVWRVGGKPTRVHPGKAAVPEFDALIIGGGEDVAPELYGQQPQYDLGEQLRMSRRRRLHIVLAELLILPAITVLRRLLVIRRRRDQEHQSRDALETRLIEQAIAAKKPILGICRGAQLLNVCLGGSLHQHLSDFYSEQPQVVSVLASTPIWLRRNSQLHRLFERRRCLVNALHSQAVDELGADMEVAAVEHGGVIQAIEHRHLPFVGVQWHPEYLPHHEHQRRLFARLVRQAAQHRSGA